jgi:hypothetical protein
MPPDHSGYRPCHGGARSPIPLATLAAVLVLVWAHASSGAEARLKQAVDALGRNQTPSGLLRYDFDFLASAPTGEDDAVRQAGVISFLAEYLLESKDPALTPIVRRGLERLEALSLPIGKRSGQGALEWTGLLSIPVGRYKLRLGLERTGLLYQRHGAGRVVTLDGSYDGAWAGATAMALLAEMQYAEATGDTRFADARRRWLHGLAALHITGSGFRSRATTIDTMPFADGEGWLALAHHERRYPGDALVRTLLPPLDTYMLRRYGAPFVIAFYQWGTMAAAVRWESTREPRFTEFIRGQAAQMLQWLDRSAHRQNTCAMVEGLATAARVLRAAAVDADLVRRLETRITAEMAKNLDLQIPANQGRFEYGKSVSLVSPPLQEFVGAFFHDRLWPYTRIDFTGHCVAAMLKLTRDGRPTQ